MHYEIINFSEQMPVRCMFYYLGEKQDHLHDYFEIIFVLKGRLQLIAGGKPYILEAEDIMTLDARVPHEIRGRESAFISVQFDQALFERTLPEPKHPEFECNSSIQRDSAAFLRLRRLIARLVKNNVDRQQGFSLRNWSLVYEIMDELYNNFRVSEDAEEEGRAHRYAERISRISAFMNAHYQENITLAMLADHVYLSVPYLSKFIKQEFGMTFHQYLTKLRLNHAVRELYGSEKTIETISSESGFPNTHAFVKAFREEHNELPSVSRRTFQRRKEERLPGEIKQHDYMAVLKKYLDAPENGQESEQTLVRTAVCDVRRSEQTLKHSWRFLLNVGSAADLLYADVQEMVRKVQKEIGFSYIKLAGILDDDLRLLSRNRQGELLFNFIYIDKILDFVFSAELKPFIQFSFMPSCLARHPQKKLFNHLVSEASDLEEWGELIRTVCRHFISRYGREELRHWRFCVWTQPDTPRNMYAFSSDALFYDFYKTTYEAVKSCDPELIFGAPASYYLPDPAEESWYVSFLEFCETAHCVPDFLNFVYYDIVPSGEPERSQSTKETFGFIGEMQLNASEDGFQNFVDQLTAATKRRLKWEKAIYLTEWNSTPSQQDLLNDSCFKSCYIVRCILENYDRLDSFAYWSLTDWMGEAPVPDVLFFGGIGMFTVNGIPKPSYYAFRMLSYLGDELLARGPGWFISKSDQSCRIMVYNYRHYSYLYAMGKRFDMTFTDRYTPFSPEQSLDFHLRLENLEDGAYTVREVILNRTSGSAFDTWIDMGAVELKTACEFRNLAARSLPALQKYILHAKDGALELDALLDLLEVRLILVDKA